MGGKKKKRSKVKVKKVQRKTVVRQQPVQTLRNQVALAEAQGAQTRLNMAAQGNIDRTNKEFSTTQDIRTIQATGAENRLTIGATADANIRQRRVEGQETRATTAATGEQERMTIGKTGAETRETIGKQAREQRTTAAQAEMFRRYKENRDFEQAQSQYRV